MKNRLLFSILLSFSIGTCFPLVYPSYWLCLNCLQVAAYNEPHLEADFKLSEVKMDLSFAFNDLWDLLPWSLQWCRFYAVINQPNSKIWGGGGEWRVTGRFEGSYTVPPLPWLRAVLQMLPSASTWHNRKGFHKALRLWKPLRKHHMALIWERPHTLQYLCHLLHVSCQSLLCFALLCWFWCRRWSWKIFLFW